MSDSVKAGELIEGRYRLVRYLGGGMSHVWLASDTRNGRQVVLKYVSASSPGALARFKREIDAMKQLSGIPSIAQIYEVLDVQGIPWIVMEYYKGALTLSDFLRAEQRQLWPAEIARLGVEVATALYHAHSLDILHRDIKPQNILIVPDTYDIVVIDFGVAKMRDSQDLTHSGQFIGTLQYAAPEQFHHGDPVTEKADVFGLGKTLAHLAEGKLPPSRSTEDSVRAGYSHDVYLTRIDLGELADLIYEMLARNPNNRPTITEVIAALNRIIQEEFASNADYVDTLTTTEVMPPWMDPAEVQPPPGDVLVAGPTPAAQVDPAPEVEPSTDDGWAPEAEPAPSSEPRSYPGFTFRPPDRTPAPWRWQPDPNYRFGPEPEPEPASEPIRQTRSTARRRARPATPEPEPKRPLSAAHLLVRGVGGLVIAFVVLSGLVMTVPPVGNFAGRFSSQLARDYGTTEPIEHTDSKTRRKYETLRRQGNLYYRDDDLEMRVPAGWEVTGLQSFSGYSAKLTIRRQKGTLSQSSNLDNEAWLWKGSYDSTATNDYLVWSFRPKNGSVGRARMFAQGDYTYLLILTGIGVFPSLNDDFKLMYSSLKSR